MKHTLQKLLSLNLALLMALSLLPGTALAAEGEPEEAAFACESGYAAAREITKAAEGTGGSVMQYFSQAAMAAPAAEEPYWITVGNANFKSDETASGTGWSYTNGVLYLSDYSGECIIAEGNLRVYSTGTVTVTAPDTLLFDEGLEGIYSTGILEIYVAGGSLTVNGGQGFTSGGDAVSAYAVFITIAGGAKAKFYGANGSTAGGDALFAPYCVDVYSTGTFRGSFVARGGDANTTDGMGGCGILSNRVFISTDGELYGGNGSSGGRGLAVYYGMTCEFAVCNLRFLSGHDANNYYFKYPIQHPDDVAEWTYNMHTTWTHPSVLLTITVNHYKLDLFGMGGTIYDYYKDTWVTYISLDYYYPATHELAAYLFTRDGYTQVNWRTTTDTLLPLDAKFTPYQDDVIKAEWEATAPGDILINGLSGKLADGSNWQKTGGGSVTLPTALTYSGESKALVGWCSEVVSTPHTLQQLLHGTWYEPGSTVTSDPVQVIDLYARPAGDGCYLVYHAGEGAVNGGGNMAAQFAKYNDAPVTFAALDGAACLTAPAGYRFAGWADAPGGEAAYSAETAVTMNAVGEKHLYAVWEPIEYGYETGLEGCEIWVDPIGKTVSAELYPKWHHAMNDPTAVAVALYDGSGRMMAVKYEEISAEGLLGGYPIDLTYSGSTLPRVRVFALNGDGAPTAKHLDQNLPELSPTDTR